MSKAAQILALISQGAPNGQIATQLGVRPEYVRATRSRYRNRPPPGRVVVLRRPRLPSQPRDELRALAARLWEMHQARLEQEALS